MKRFTALLLLSILVFALTGCGLFSKPGTVTGKVTDQLTNAPVAGAQVTIGDQSVSTNEQGIYTLDVKHGTYNLTVKKENYTDYTKKDIVVLQKETITENVLLEPITGTVAGTVTDQLTYLPVEGALVTVGSMTVTSAADGSYTTAIIVGTHALTVQKAGYKNFAQQEVVVTANTTTTVNPDLQSLEKGSISGVVTDSLTSNPIANVAITVGEVTVSTDAQGAYALINVFEGEYTVSGLLADYQTYTGALTVVANGNTNHDVVLYSSVIGNISGTVMENGTQNPIEGASVSFGEESVVVGADGKFEFAGVAVGSYTLIASADGYYTVDEEVVVEGGKVANPKLVTGTAIITGIITDGRGGPVVSGATVKFNNCTATTSGEDGRFELITMPDTGDVLIEKAGRSSARVQDVQVVTNETKFYEIPTRAVLNPNWSIVPARIVVTGVESGDILTGEVTFTLSVEGDHDTFVYYAYVGGEQRAPRVDYQLSTDNGEVTFDSSLWPNGSSYLKIMAYDVNENMVMLYIPVTIQNEANDEAIPGEIPYIQNLTYTYGQNVGYYSETPVELASLKHPVKINAFTENATMYNYLSWDPAPGADGYSVYRSADMENWTKIGDITVMEETWYAYYDYSTALVALETLFYKVIPYNSFGVAENPAVVSATPLPTMNLSLVSPANDATNVSLTPTLTWEYDFMLYGEGGITYRTYLRMYDSMDYKIIDTLLKDGSESYTVPGVLEPGCVYTWDVYKAYAYAIFELEETVVSVSYTYANQLKPAGSLNGEFSFTTTTEIGQ